MEKRCGASSPTLERRSPAGAALLTSTRNRSKTKQKHERGGGERPALTDAGLQVTGAARLHQACQDDGPGAQQQAQQLPGAAHHAAGDQAHAALQAGRDGRGGQARHGADAAVEADLRPRPHAQRRAQQACRAFQVWRFASRHRWRRRRCCPAASASRGHIEQLWARMLGCAAEAGAAARWQSRPGARCWGRAAGCRSPPPRHHLTSALVRPVHCR